MNRYNPWLVTNEGQQFIKEIAKDIVAEMAPKEMPLYGELIEEYFDDPTPPDFSSLPHDPLQSGIDEVFIAMTPAITAVLVVALSYLSRQLSNSPSQLTIQEQISELREFCYETGLAELLRRIPSDHPKHLEALTYEQRLIDNLKWARLYGYTPEVRAERADIVNGLNRFALSTLAVSFSELCHIVETPYQTELKQTAVQQAQEFGILEVVTIEKILELLFKGLTQYFTDEHDE